MPVAAVGGFNPRGSPSGCGSRRHANRSGVVPFVQAAENHFARRRLVNRSNQNVHGAVDQAPRPIHHHHRAVVQISNSLGRLLPFPQDQHPHRLPGQHRGLQSVGQLVDIQHGNILHPRNLVQIVIVGDYLCAGAAGKFDKFLVHA